jgi:tRNA pseudouridine55 synthase
MLPAPGIYLVHKAVGETSFSLVQRFAEEVRLAGIRPDKLPVCHGGALDPFAGGLMLLLAGQATRLFELLHPIPKTYVAEISWGVETDNGDPLGAPIESGDVSRLTPALLSEKLQPFIGWQEQVPPLHSNKRVDGERAYEKAHRGESFELPPSRVYLHSARFLEHDLPRTSRLELTARGGYYVRSLARDLGRATGARAHLSKLQRTQIGPWADPGPERVHLSGGELLPWCPSRQVTQRELNLLRSHREIPLGEIAPPAWPLPSGFPDPEAPIRALLEGKLVALLRVRDAKLFASPALKSPV